MENNDMKLGVRRYSSKYVDLELNNRESVFLETFKKSTNEWTDRNYRTYEISKMSVMKSKKPLHLISDRRELAYDPTGHARDWVASSVEKDWGKIGIKKRAIVVSEPHLNKLSGGNQCAVRIIDGVKQRFFSNMNDAKMWVKGNSEI